ncbi:hypothetical protein [Leucobacter sp.]
MTRSRGTAGPARPHRKGVGRLDLTGPEQNDLAVLEQIVTDSFRALSSGTSTRRAREASSDDSSE